ncbi:hypothetical protein ACWERY_26560 [Streptomyces sp. NPDC004082]
MGSLLVVLAVLSVRDAVTRMTLVALVRRVALVTDVRVPGRSVR